MRAQRWVANDFGGSEALHLQSVDLSAPVRGEVTIAVRASGMNPADAKHIAPGQDPKVLPLTLGYEVAGVVSAIGPDTQLASGGGSVGDEVVAFQITGGWASAVTTPAVDVFAKPASLSFAEAANLLLVGTTAAELLHAAAVANEETVLLHGASGSVGVSVLQQAALLGVRVIGTTGPSHAATVATFGGHPVEYGPGLIDRVRELAPEGIAAALDTAGTDEAIDVSLALVADRRRVVSIAAFSRAGDGITLLGSGNPASAAFRASARPRLLELAASRAVVPLVAGTFPFNEAPAAFAELVSRRPGGKLALVDEG